MRKLVLLLGLLTLAIGSANAQKVPVPAPLTGTVTLNSWVSFDQTFSGITLACGRPFHFNVAKPPQYNPTSYKYPLYIWLHPDRGGDPWYLQSNLDPLRLTGAEGGSYNTVAWQTKYPAIYVIPYADQTNGNNTTGSCTGEGADAVINWGGWFNNGTTGTGTHSSGDTGPNVFAVLAMVNFLETQYSVDSSRIYINGFSLGGHGAAYFCQHYNIINGSPAIFGACLQSGGGADEADAPVTSTTIAKMSQVPMWYFGGKNDANSPQTAYNIPLCDGLGGNSSAHTAITSATVDRCGTSQMRYTLCPTCGHQDTDANGAPVWTNQLMNDFAFAQGGGGGINPATAQRSADFLNMIGVQGCLTGGGAAPCTVNGGQSEVNDLQYLGITHYRSGFDIDLTLASPSQIAFTTLLNSGISMIAGPPYPSSPTAPTTLTTTTPANQISQAHAWQAINPNAIAILDGINEPGLLFPTVVYGSNGVTSNCAGSGGAAGDGCTWLPVVQYQRDYVAALLADNALKNIPILTASRVGEEPSNVGAQFATIQGSSSSLPAGTVLGQYLNNHVYPTDQQFDHVGVVGACQPNDPTAGNAFNIATHWDNVVTFVGGFAGYATDAIAQSQPRAVTEFGYPTRNPGPSANGDRVTEDKKGRCIMNGLLTAWQMGMKVVSIYSLYSSAGDPGFGLMAGTGSPNLSGSYLHNLTTVLTDTGATARTFTPGTITYAVTNLPSSGGQQLFQKSNGHFQLVLWNNATNWNMGTGAPITVTPVNVAVNFSGGTLFTMSAFDPVANGTNPIQTITSGNAITVAVADYPVVIDVIPATTAAETLTFNPIAQQAATVPFTVSGSIANASGVPTLQYAVNGGTYQAIPASTGTRDPYNQPGSNASTWNTPFGTGQTWLADNDPQTLAICNGTCTGIITTTGNFGIVRWTSSGSPDSTYSFMSTLNGRTKAPDNGSTLSATMHVPTGAITGGPYTGNQDKGFVLQDKASFPNRQYTWATISPNGIAPPGIQPGQGPFSTLEGAEWDDITSDQYGEDYDTGLSGINQGAGLINACDVTPSCNPDYPRIKHGFGYNLSPNQFKSNATPVTGQVLNPSGWPLRLQDGQTGGNVYTGKLLFGSTLGIPITATMPTNLDANCQGAFWTMQHYGMYPRDVSGGGLHLRVDQVADTSAYVASLRGCLAQISGFLRVLSNQHQGGQSFTTQPKNGPGNRVDTGPLPLTGGTGNTVTQTAFTFTVPGLAAGSANTISVRDANNTSIVGTSNQFVVTGSSGPLPGTPNSPLPGGYLHVSGNQIVDGGGTNVRLACEGYDVDVLTPNFGADMGKIRSQGFNCVRYLYRDATTCPGGTCNFTTFDQFVSAATANNLKVIFDHHGNEAGSGGQQPNGLWYDVNSTTPVAGVTWNALNQNTDGAGHAGTVTYAQFKANFLAIAQHYAGNATVIGYDLDNEAFIGGQFQTTPVNWGGNNGADERLMCNDVGSALEAASPGVLIICEGPINFVGPFLDGTAFPSGGRNIQDLTKAATTPVILTGDTGKHVVYSVHDYPNDISGNVPDSGTAGAQFRIKAYGFLETQNIAPVWVGEIGSSLDGTTGNLADEQAWASMITALLNGQDGAIGGPTFTGCQQPMGTDWFAYGNYSGQPDGTLNANGTNKAGQFAVWNTFLYTTCSQNTPPSGAGNTTWNPGDNSGTTLSAANTVSTGTGAHQGVRSTTSQTAGKTCFEVTATTITANWAAGLANSTFPLTGSGLGGDANGIGIDPNSTGGAQGIFYNNAVLASGAGASPNGEAQTICVDLGARLWWSTNATQRAASHPWNNSATANPATGVGGLAFTGLTGPYFVVFNTSEATSVAAINAAGPFAVSTPAGFSAWQAPITTGNHPILINLGN